MDNQDNKIEAENNLHENNTKIIINTLDNMYNNKKQIKVKKIWFIILTTTT